MVDPFRDARHEILLLVLQYNIQLNSLLQLGETQPRMLPRLRDEYLRQNRFSKISAKQVFKKVSTMNEPGATALIKMCMATEFRKSSLSKCFVLSYKQ